MCNHTQAKGVVYCLSHALVEIRIWKGSVKYPRVNKLCTLFSFSVVIAMERSSRNRNQLPTNLPQLQNLIKRDSQAYKDEVWDSLGASS